MSRRRRTIFLLAALVASAVLWLARGAVTTPAAPDRVEALSPAEHRQRSRLIKDPYARYAVHFQRAGLADAIARKYDFRFEQRIVNLYQQKVTPDVANLFAARFTPTADGVHQIVRLNTLIDQRNLTPQQMRKLIDRYDAACAQTSRPAFGPNTLLILLLEDHDPALAARFMPPIDAANADFCISQIDLMIRAGIVSERDVRRINAYPPACDGFDRLVLFDGDVTAQFTDRCDRRLQRLGFVDARLTSTEIVELKNSGVDPQSMDREDIARLIDRPAEQRAAGRIALIKAALADYRQREYADLLFGEPPR